MQQSASIKRFQNDLKRKLVTFPCSVSECGLGYNDFIKVQKRADTGGINAGLGGERYVWILRVLSELETWAASALSLDESRSHVRELAALITSAESQWGVSFMKSVPLYQLLVRSNRKLFRVLAEYDSREELDWVPQSIEGVTDDTILSNILTPSDYQKVINFRTTVLTWNSDFSNTQNLLQSLHPDDLRHTGLPAMTPTSMSGVRVGSALVCKLATAYCLSASLSPISSRQVAKLLQRSGDVGFRKFWHPKLTELTISEFPARVNLALNFLTTRFPPKRHHTVSRREASVSKIQTRQTRRRKATHVSGFLSLGQIEKIVKFGKEHAIHETACLALEFEQVKKILSDLANCIDRSYCSSEADDLYLLRSVLKFRESEICQIIRKFRFNFNLVVFRSELDRAKLALGLIRFQLSAIHFLLFDGEVNYDDLEQLVSDAANFFDEMNGPLKQVVDFFNAKLKIPIFKSLSQLEEFLTTQQIDDATSLVRIDWETCTAVVAAKDLWERSKKISKKGLFLMNEIDENFENISQDRYLELSLLMDEVKQFPLAFAAHWVNVLGVIEWTVAVKRELLQGDINALISLQSRRPLGAVSDELETRIAAVQSLIAELENDLRPLKLLKAICVPSVETVRMGQEDFFANLNLLTQTSVLDVNQLERRVGFVESWNRRFGILDNLELPESFAVIFSVHEKIKTVDEKCAAIQLLAELKTFDSVEIRKLKRSLEKATLIEAQIDSVLKSSTDSSIAKLVELIDLKSGLLQKSRKMRLIDLPKRNSLVVSLFKTVARICRVWIVNRKTMKSGPHWLYFFMLRAVGGRLNVLEDPDFLFVSSQLNCCNEILKESKKNFALFCHNRFLIPQFHCNLFEPMAQIAQAKYPSAVLNYKAADCRQLESIALVVNGRVTERCFPKVGSINSEEPGDSEKISTHFSQRSVPSTIEEATSILLRVAKLVGEEIQVAKEISRKSGKSTPNESNGLSFTKFLMTNSFDQVVVDHQDNEWVTDQVVVDKVNAQPGDTFFSKYFNLMQKQVEPSPVTETVIVPTVAPYIRAPGFAPPPKDSRAPELSRPQVAASRPIASFRPGTCIWKGAIEGLKNHPKFSVSLFPLFSPVAPTIQPLLGEHKVWQFEGAMGTAKFEEYYAKLVVPEHRRKREPYSFAIAIEKEDLDVFNLAIPEKTAQAFAILVPPYKLKLWILRTDGQQRLPVTAGTIFGFMELPVALVKSTEGVCNDLALMDKIVLPENQTHNHVVPQHMVDLRQEVEENKQERPYLGAPAYIGYGRTVQNTGGLVIGAPSSGQTSFSAPRRGVCKFFNLAQGCQSGDRCKFLHLSE